MTDRNDQPGDHSGTQAVMVAHSFIALADTLVDDFDVVELLDRLVADCVTLLDVSAAGILLLNQDRVLEVVASSNEASHLMEVFQLESRSGPCVDAVMTGEPVAITQPAAILERWPAFGRTIGKVGFTAVYALPMRLRDETIGALNLFNASKPPLTEFDQRLAQALADIATIGILQQRALARSASLAEQLQLALNTRITVEQAKGVIAEFGGVDMATAFEAIRSFARQHQAKLSNVAHRLTTRELDPGRILPHRTDR